jgi:hypothetical protein
VVLQYISTYEQISRYFGKSSVQDERVCILKKQDGACGDDFLIEKKKREEMTTRLGGRTDVLLIYGQSFFKFEKWSRMSSSFPIRKVV